jgi:hypothetical protein
MQENDKSCMRAVTCMPGMMYAYAEIKANDDQNSRRRDSVAVVGVGIRKSGEVANDSEKRLRI